MSWRRCIAELVHRGIWQRLPHGLRRSVLLRSAALIAPGRDAAATPAEPIFVAGYLRTASGLGESARLLHNACCGLGLDTRGIDLSAGQMQPTDLAPLGSTDARSHRGPGTVLLHVNPPLVPLAMLQLGRGFLKGKHIVGCWAWELEALPSDWHHGLAMVHQAWVPSQFTAAAIRRTVSGLPLRVVPYPVAVHTPAAAGQAGGRFRALMIFNAASGFARKNPCAGIAAFRKAFGAHDEAELIVKSSHLGVYPEGRTLIEAAIGGQANIRHIAEVLAPSERDALYASAHAILSLHRSEGFGLVLAEAMLRGLPVVATDWSGNTDFLDAQNGCPVRASRTPARDLQGIYDLPGQCWAEPDVGHAAELLRRLQGDPEWRADIGRRASEDARRLFSVEAFGATMHDLLSAGASDDWIRAAPRSGQQPG